ncbi:5'-nucleotidase, lipoprotein e(P4) family [Modicisalibacter coralii]|uniref:5'-nucleotidase, lipoprotein e(P4) family n=1 Tax=Modicisalibacter coralii TaxID=2304602 RepID=UPI00100AE744|nr:5'-nucleotidase, lipoprotein e(P4) family [Halomonas coralii]
MSLPLLRPSRHLSRSRQLAGLALTGLLLTGCASQSATPTSNPAYSQRDLNEQLVMATAWMQSAAEYRALSYQAFNVARDRLDAILDEDDGNRPLAVVVDCDETVIDNSAFEAYLVGRDAAYDSERWHRWMEDRQAKAMPGALDFLTYADEQGVDIYYITNRDADALEATRDNLEALGFPQADDDHLMLRTDTSDKQPRRDAVLADHRVALYMGDNLSDFESQFDSDDPAERRALATARQARFGRHFILLPNPAYGAWEGAIYGGDWGLSPAQKDKARKAALEPWQPTGTP